MAEKLVPFWEQAYQSDDLMAFSAQPNRSLTEFEHLLPADAHILEAGCGEGQNVLYLARQGYQNIEAFDLSAAGTAKLDRLCALHGLHIHTFVQDLRTYTFTRPYDLVMSFATLCFVEKKDWKQFIENAKANTRVGGIHIMHTFTDTVPTSPDIAPFAIGLAHEGELKDLYADWEILQFESHVFEDEHPNVPKHLHAVNKVVARKRR